MHAITPFKGRVLIGVGRLLRIYDLGKKKLLRKCENKVRPFFTMWGKREDGSGRGYGIDDGIENDAPRS